MEARVVRVSSTTTRVVVLLVANYNHWACMRNSWTQIYPLYKMPIRSRLQGSWTGGLCAQQVRSYFYKLQEMIVRNPLSNVYTNGRDANLFVHICCGCLSSGAGKGSKLPHQLAECYVEPWHVWIFLMSRTHISTDICVLAGPSITWFFIDGVDVKLIREPEREDVPLRGKGNPTVSGMPKSSEVPCNCLFYDIPYCRDIRTVPVVVQPLSTAGMHLWWH